VKIKNSINILFRERRFKMEMDERIRYAIEQTRILKPPRQLLATFGSSVVYYYLLTEPLYLKVTGKKKPETVIREGRLSWERPKLITPYYMFKMEGFSEEARETLQMLAEKDPDLAGILYEMEYKKDLEKMTIVSNPLFSVAEKISEEIERKNQPLTAIIKGLGELWDVSLSWFIHRMVQNSFYLSQLPDFSRRGLITPGRFGEPAVARDEFGIPLVARNEIEQMFKQVKKGELEPSRLKRELDKWGLFKEYEDRFFNLFRKK